MPAPPTNPSPVQESDAQCSCRRSSHNYNCPPSCQSPTQTDPWRSLGLCWLCDLKGFTSIDCPTRTKQPHPLPLMCLPVAPAPTNSLPNTRACIAQSALHGHQPSAKDPGHTPLTSPPARNTPGHPLTGLIYPSGMKTLVQGPS